MKIGPNIWYETVLIGLMVFGFLNLIVFFIRSSGFLFIRATGFGLLLDQLGFLGEGVKY